MNRRPLLFTGAALFLSIAAACSSSSSSDGAGPGTGADQDAGGDLADGDSGAGSDGAAAKTTKVGALCTGPGQCSTGQACIGISQHGGEAICLETCKSSADCSGDATCENQICNPTCSDGCPSAMECISDINECMFDCGSNSKLCGPNEMCSQGIQCVPAVPDAGPLTCKPGGGTASSGITGSKTVGALTGTEQATFCDWAAAVTGGYGCKEDCDGGVSASFSASQSTCTAQFTKSGCAATVSDVEACVKENAQNVCALDILSSPTCASLRACF